MRMSEKFNEIARKLASCGFDYEDLEEYCFERNSLRIYLCNDVMRIQYMDSYMTVPKDEITYLKVVCDAVEVWFGKGFFVRFENV